jgi:Aminoglycoside-2''-adenylyltransferase
MVDRSSRPTATPVPQALAYVRDLLLGFDPPWFLCGGWAADAWLGQQTRHHGDVDIAVFRHDQYAIFEHLSGWAMVGHDPNVADDTAEPWNGRHLDLPAHIHVPGRRSPLATSTTATHAALEIEFLLADRSDDHWILNREAHIAVPLDRGIRQSPWGLQTAAPEAVLFYKASGHLTAAEVEGGGSVLRPRDEQDFHALLPALNHPQRSWLRESLARVQPEHPWLAHLGS